MLVAGAPNFPDPTQGTDGGAQTFGSSVNRNSPAFQHATAVCNNRGSS